MELNKVETGAIADAVREANENDLRHLEDLQLALIGGGIADVIAG